MESLNTGVKDIAFQKDFLLLNFKNTQDIRTQQDEFINRVKFWFLTVWLAIVSFIFNQKLEIFDSIILMFIAIFAFWFISLKMKIKRERLGEMIRQFEVFIMTATDFDIINLNGPLLTKYVPPTKKHSKQIVKDVLFSWYHNDIFLIIFCVSIIISYFLGDNISC